MSKDDTEWLDRLKIQVDAAIAIRDAGMMLPMKEQDLSYVHKIPSNAHAIIGDFGIIFLKTDFHSVATFPPWGEKFS